MLATLRTNGVLHHAASDRCTREPTLLRDARPMIRPLKIAHTSDVHLHDGDDGQPVRDAFARVIDTVLDARSDLFLIAGDLFDHNRIQGDVIDFVYEAISRSYMPARWRYCASAAARSGFNGGVRLTANGRCGFDRRGPSRNYRSHRAQ